MFGNRHLCKYDALGISRIRPVYRRHQNNQRGGRAQNNGVDKNTQRLHQPLRHGVRHIGCSGDIRHGAETSLIREQATSRPLSNRRGHTTTDSLLQAKSGGKYQRQRARYLRHVEGQHDQSHREVPQDHQRHNHLGHQRQPANATKENDRHNCRHHHTADHCGHAKSGFNGCGHHIALHSVKAEPDCDQ